MSALVRLVVGALLAAFGARAQFSSSQSYKHSCCYSTALLQASPYAPWVRGYQGQYYALYDCPLPWDEAERVCQRAGGQLASINSVKEQQWLEDMIYRWSDGSYLYGDGFYSKWETSDGQPNCAYGGDVEQCVHMVSWTYEWNDAECANRYKFVCESSRGGGGSSSGSSGSSGSSSSSLNNQPARNPGNTLLQQLG